MTEGYARILIFNVNWLGDVLFSTAAIRNIRRNFPQSFIACIVPSRCYQVLKGNPHLDEVIIYDEKDRHRGVFEKLKFVQYLKSKRFDVAFLLHRSFSRALLCRLADIPQRIGYHTRKRGFILTTKIAAPPAKSLHRIDYYLNLLEKAGLRVEDRFSEFFISDADVEFLSGLLERWQVGKEDFVVALNSGGNWLYKRWPKEYWAELADELILKQGAKVVIVGSSYDIPLAEEIRLLMRYRPIIACGLLNLKQTGALFKRADVVISADTGPLHIANSVSAKKIIALFGPTSPKITGPYPFKNVVVLQKEVGCPLPCYSAHCKDNRCMKAISPAEVYKIVEGIRSHG